jgi:hypothetical protein
LVDGSGAELPLCQPPDTFRSLAVEVVETGLQQFADQLPASVSFDISTATEVSPGLRLFRIILHVWLWMPWLTLGLAFVLVLILGGSMRSALLGIGLPLSLAGVIAAGIALALAALRQTVLLPWLEHLINTTIPDGLSTIVTTVVANVFGRFCLSALVWGAAAVVLGMALVIFSRLVGRHSTP